MGPFHNPIYLKRAEEYRKQFINLTAQDYDIPYETIEFLYDKYKEENGNMNRFYKELEKEIEDFN